MKKVGGSIQISEEKKSRKYKKKVKKRIGLEGETKRQERKKTDAGRERKTIKEKRQRGRKKRMNIYDLEMSHCEQEGKSTERKEIGMYPWLIPHNSEH